MAEYTTAKPYGLVCQHGACMFLARGMKKREAERAATSHMRVMGSGHGVAMVRKNPHHRRRRYRRNPLGMRSSSMLGLVALGVGVWWLFRAPAGGGPSLWQTLTAPSVPASGYYPPGTVSGGTIPGAIATTGGNLVQSVGSGIASWINSL